MIDKIEKEVAKTLKLLQRHKSLPLCEALSEAYGIRYYPLCEMSVIERALCSDVLEKNAVCITSAEGRKIFYNGNILSASLHIVHEFGHIILNLPDDPESENSVNLFTALLISNHYTQHKRRAKMALSILALASIVIVSFLVGRASTPNKPTLKSQTLIEYRQSETGAPLVYITRTGQAYNEVLNCQCVRAKHIVYIELEHTDILHMIGVQNCDPN